MCLSDFNEITGQQTFGPTVASIAATHNGDIEGDDGAHDDHRGEGGEAGDGGEGERGRVQNHSHVYKKCEQRHHGSQFP